MNIQSIQSLVVPAQVGPSKVYFFINSRFCGKGSDCATVPHDHGKSYELRYIASGSGIQNIDGNELLMTTGDMVLTHPNEHHYMESKNCSSDLVHYAFCFSVKQPNDTATVQEKRTYTDLIKILDSTRCVREQSLKLKPFWDLILDEFLGQRDGYFNYLQSMCTVILTEFLRLANEGNENRLFPPTDLKYNNVWRDLLYDFFAIHYMENVKLQDLADMIKVSRRQISRVFLQEFGMTFIEKLTETRLHHVKHQLRTTDKDIHSVCADCGFQSYSYFTTCFRKNTGMTPSEYRNHFQKKKK